MSNQGRCWYCGQPRKEIHETLTCGSEECVAAALKSREKSRQKDAKSKAMRRKRSREYYERPEVKARMREYQREYIREYRQRPEVKARRREYERARYQRKKAQEEE